MAEWNLNFMHPQYGTMFPTMVDGTFTAQEMLDNLVTCGFLQPDPDGYILADGDAVIASDTLFDDIPELYDGAMLRIKRGAAVPTNIGKSFFVCFLHPHQGWETQMEVDTDQTPQTLLTLLLQRGFFTGALSQFALAHKNNLLEGNKPLHEYGIRQGDFIEIVDLTRYKLPPTDQLIRQLATELPNNQQGIFQQLQAILNGLPRPSSLPIDAVLTINPTQVVYESLDTLISNIHRMDNLPPPRRIHSRSIIPWLMVLALMALAIVAGIFWHHITALFGG